MPDTGLLSPAAEGDDYSDWNNPTNAYASDDAVTDPSAPSDEHDYYDFSPTITAGATINGIEILCEMHAHNVNEAIITLELSYDGGANYTTSGKSVAMSGTGDTTETAGGAADTWGRSWSVSEFTNANFRVRITEGGGVKPYLDHLQARITYTEATARRIFITHA